MEAVDTLCTAISLLILLSATSVRCGVNSRDEYITKEYGFDCSRLD